MIVTVSNAHDAVTLTKQWYIYHTTLSYCLDLLILTTVTASSSLNVNATHRRTHTHVMHTHTHTYKYTTEHRHLFFSPNRPVSSAVSSSVIWEKSSHRQHHPMTRGSHQRSTHPPSSANQPSSSLSSLGRNLYCCCRIWASFFRASSSSRSFLSISSWAAMIWGEWEQMTENVPFAHPNPFPVDSSKWKPCSTAALCSADTSPPVNS